MKEGDALRGQARLYMGLHRAEAYAVGCLFTSVGYGWNVDHSGDILDATLSAVETMVGIAKVHAMDIHSPRFNSGLFKIPWDETEERLKSVLENYPDVKWTVWTGKA